MSQPVCSFHATKWCVCSPSHSSTNCCIWKWITQMPVTGDWVTKYIVVYFRQWNFITAGKVQQTLPHRRACSLFCVYCPWLHWGLRGRVDYRHTLFYCTFLQIFHFLQIKALWQLCTKSINTISPHSFAYLVSLCYIIIICDGDLWSVLFDAPIVIVWGARNHTHIRWENLIDKCCACSYCSTKRLSHLSPSPEASLFPETPRYWNQANW